MRVLHILPMNKLSGAEKLSLEICKNMEKYKPIVVCGGNELKKFFDRENIEAYTIEFNEIGLKKSLKELREIIIKKNIKLVHAHDNNASIKALLTKKIYRLDIKVISHIHNCYPWLVGKNKIKLIDYIFRKGYDHNIACGKLVYDFYTQNTNYVNDKNTTILSNCIDVKGISNGKTNNLESVYEEFKIPKDKKILGFIGRMSEQKGIVDFVNNIAKNKTKFCDCKILLVGNGEQENELRDIIRSNDMEELFILTGYQNDVYKFYPIIDVFFLPSKYEGLPMVILEAMAFKKPIVSMNVGSIDEVVKDNFNGYIIDKNDYNQFIDKLLDLKENEKLQENFGVNGYIYALANYHIDDYIDNLIKIYDKLTR